MQTPLRARNTRSPRVIEPKEEKKGRERKRERERERERETAMNVPSLCTSICHSKTMLSSRALVTLKKNNNGDGVCIEKGVEWLNGGDHLSNFCSIFTLF